MEDTTALRIERRDDVAILWLDAPGEKVNVLNREVADALDQAFDELAGDRGVRALVVASAKKDNFVAGADVKMLQAVESADEAEDIVREGQRIMNKIATFPRPVVAAIHGACLGGGLELALACTDRIASDHEKTELGHPEVMLGLIPAAGGTQRLPRTIGLERSLEMILTGKPAPAKKAEKIGLVKEVVHPNILLDVAIDHARELAGKHGEPGIVEKARNAIGSITDPAKVKALVLEDNPAGRRVMFNQARKNVLSRTHGNMPAPLEAIDVIRTGIEEGLEEGLKKEAEVFGELAVTREAKNMMALFFAREALKKEKGADADPREVHKIGVLGAGLMGSGIAAISASNAGVSVRMKDVDHEKLRQGLRAVRSSVEERAAKKRMLPAEKERIINMVSTTTDYTGFRHADVVIEAVVEDLEVKHQVLQELEENMGDEMIFATNTSSLPIGDIAEASNNPERVAGMHYFSPVEKVPLLEVVAGEQTAPWVVATCVELGKRQGKTVIVVNDGTGFYTTRILGPYLAEVGHLLEEGVPVDRIDEALVEFGFPMGPVRLLDQVGIDVGEKISQVLQDEFGERMASTEVLGKMLEDDRAGEKSGKGFYKYEKGPDGFYEAKDDEVDPSAYDVLGVEPTSEPELEEIALRCALGMVNEAVRCYGDGVLRSARDGDVGAVFGMGFPPFRGGPFRFIDNRGPQEVVRQLEEFQQRYGDRFEPAPLLRSLAEKNVRFHSDEAPAPGERAQAASVE